MKAFSISQVSLILKFKVRVRGQTLQSYQSFDPFFCAVSAHRDNVTLRQWVRLSSFDLHQTLTEPGDTLRKLVAVSRQLSAFSSEGLREKKGTFMATHLCSESESFLNLLQNAWLVISLPFE